MLPRVKNLVADNKRDLSFRSGNSHLLVSVEVMSLKRLAPFRETDTEDCLSSCEAHLDLVMLKKTYLPNGEATWMGKYICSVRCPLFVFTY